MEIKNERELRCMLFGMTVGRALSVTNTTLTSKDMYFGDFEAICIAVCQSGDKLKVISACTEERDNLSIEGAMRVSKIEARDAWLSMFEHSEEDT